MKKIIVSAVVLMAGALLVGASAAQPNAKKMSKLVNEALSFSEKQSLVMFDKVKDQADLLPNTTKDGKLQLCKSREWVSGFYPGTLWYLYENSGNKAVLDAAEVVTERILPEQYNKNSHDVGFVVNCSFGNGYRLTGREDYRQVLINAGNSLATRFNENVGCTRSWKSRPNQGWDFIVIIDNMMNLELLTVSSALSGDLANYNIAKTHANTTMKNHFRPDGSSFHVVNYDGATGNVLTKQTYQGLADDSSWSRGQGWGLYGFTMMYRQTGNLEYLEHAVKIGKYIMNHPNLPKDKVPYWDYAAPASKSTPRDASAASLMASAYIELSTYVQDEKLSQQFLTLAEQILVSLSSPAYRAKLGTNEGFILKHATIFYGKNNFDTPVSYADYYYVEALMRYKRLLEGKPVVPNTTVASETPDRAFWVSSLDHIARPLLTHFSKGTLKANMPVESIAADLKKRYECTHLEALGRIVVGIAPWLELGPDQTPEGKLRAEYIDLTLKAIANGVDPQSPDYLNFNKGRQPLVDAAFLAHGLLRAPTQLWGKLSDKAKADLVRELKSSRVIKPSETNWLFFSAMVEAALYEFTGECEQSRIDYAFSKFMNEWYKGDGFYGDGPAFHMDYYNSFVIQPMMMQILDVLKKHNLPGAEYYDVEKERFSRYAEIQERMISPEGTFPIVGRSLAYRFGAFQALSDVSLRHALAQHITPAQVRCALTAVMKRQISAPGTFDANGWLRPGFCGHQPHIGEGYISTGSLYLCSGVFVALGLSETDEFWSAPDTPWTNKKGWSGVDIMLDHAIKN